MIVASLALRVMILRDAYFIEDDFLFVGDAYEHNLTFDFLFRMHKGHLMPGALALTWVLSRISAYDWLLVAGVTLALQALISVLGLRLLVRLFGVRPGILLPLAVLLFCPLTVPALSWWSAAINAVPLQLAIVLALTSQARFTSWRAFGWTLFAMAFSTKAVFLPFLLFALTTAFFRDTRAGWVTSMRRELRGHWRHWVAYAVLLGGYAVLYLARRGTAPGEGAAVPNAEASLNLVANLLGRTFPSGAVGGPLAWGPVASTGGVADPGGFIVVAAWVALGLVVAGTLIWRRHAVRAWVVLVAYVVLADVIPTVIARGSVDGVVGAETRYVADAVVVLAVCLALALLPVAGEADPYRRALPSGSAVPVVAGLMAGAYLMSSVMSIDAFRQTLSGDKVRGYLDTVRTSLARAPKDTAIYSTPLPADIVLPWNGNRRLSHHLLSPLAPPGLRAGMSAPQPSEHAMVLDDRGRLVPLAVKAAFFQLPPPGKRCVRFLMGATYFPDATSWGQYTSVAGFAYSAPRPLSAIAEIGGSRIGLNFSATRSGMLHMPIAALGRGLKITLVDPSAKLCITGVAVGEPVPDVAAR